MTEQSRFPIVFEKCPNCGCKDTLTRLAWEEEADKGRVNGDLFASAEKFLIPLIDPARPPKLSASGLLIHYDACSDCGTRYCTKAEIVTGPVTMKMPPGGMQGPGGSPFFGKG